ncbi:MAG TPA: BTAD domain-containing putative transcriptional regulator, partial [Symbiobacteriaceae bacterium]|nr:BTAD domain-containing putative transcriptional regulator [Symbiobacteriaceae bacterium]
MQLQLRLFGAFQAAIDDRPIPGHHWRRTAPRSLLQYLATRRSRYATADELMETFWADLPLENAKSSLQVAVSRLRSILRSALPLGTPDSFVRFTGTGYQLESTSIDLLDLYQQGPQLRQLAIPEPAATLVKLELIDLPDAADLLPEHPYADWAEATRKQAQAELSALYLLRADLRTQAKRYQGALADLRYVLQREPTRESVALKAMHLAADLGDRAAALALFHQCSTALAEELGLDPTPELITLHTQLLREEVAVGALMAEPEPPRAAHRSNLPTNLSSFVGREADLEELAALLTGETPHRLVTLSGPGGSGKTRLALEVARALASRFPDGICLVELAELRDGSLLAKTVAAALELQGAPSQSPLDLLRSYLGAKRLLLILDNCEHLLKAVAGLVEQLLHAAPHLQLLATSRQSLGLMGEVIWPVMPLPQPLGVQLFIDRAVSALPRFVATPENARYIEQICRCLDGIPLAIELAAARVRLLPVREIAQRLRDRFRFLSYGLPALGARHHSLRAALDWSYELLAEPERILFRRLGLFAGSFGLEAAESICSGPELEPAQVIDLLHSLVDKSLVVADLDSFPARFKLLETLRTYA